jgi:hypothetical protein
MQLTISSRRDIAVLQKESSALRARRMSKLVCMGDYIANTRYYSPDKANFIII